jgi:hypothetical protein
MAGSLDLSENGPAAWQDGGLGMAACSAWQQ